MRPFKWGLLWICSGNRKGKIKKSTFCHANLQAMTLTFGISCASWGLSSYSTFFWKVSFMVNWILKDTGTQKVRYLMKDDTDYPLHLCFWLDLNPHIGLEIIWIFWRVTPDTYRGYETMAKSVWETRLI